MKKWLTSAFFLLASFIAMADLAVQNIQVQQRWPWNGLVDIDYELICDEADADLYVFFSGTDKDLNQQVAMLTLTGDGANGTAVKAGKHRITWDMSADAPNLHTTAFSVHIEVCKGSGLYLVIDLSNGPNAENYPYEYSMVGPDLSNDSCRTDKLWLHFIPPNSSAVTGVNVDYGYYMGIFEVTQAQYARIMGGTSTSTVPQILISYNAIRGSSEGAGYPTHNRVDASSFMGKLRARTGLNCDLPTDGQWEYACRAGTTSEYSNVAGKNSADVARSSTIYQKVGLLLPNAWGCYDMLGNVYEWCRNWSSLNSRYRSARGGSYAGNCYVTYKGGNIPTYTSSDVGFRLVILPADK